MVTVTADNPQPSVMAVSTVSVLDIFAKVVEIQVELGRINTRLDDLPDHETRIRLLEQTQAPDHEARIRVLEQTRARLYGACALLAVVAGGAAGWVALILGHR